MRTPFGVNPTEFSSGLVRFLGRPAENSVLVAVRVAGSGCETFVLVVNEMTNFVRGSMFRYDFLGRFNFGLDAAMLAPPVGAAACAWLPTF
jgi:hypothetical protein